MFRWLANLFRPVPLDEVVPVKRQPSQAGLSPLHDFLVRQGESNANAPSSPRAPFLVPSQNGGFKLDEAALAAHRRQHIKALKKGIAERGTRLQIDRQWVLEREGLPESARGEICALYAQIDQCMARVAAVLSKHPETIARNGTWLQRENSQPR